MKILPSLPIIYLLIPFSLHSAENQPKEPLKTPVCHPLGYVKHKTTSNSMIKSINIKINPIFDLDDPDEDIWLFQTANALHITTQENVIAKDLLFREGQIIDSKLLAETERRLRARSYINTAKITISEQCVDGLVIDVEVQEVWTLEPEISYSQTGDTNSFTFGLSDSNFLGLGKSINLSRSYEDDRESTIFDYFDPNTGFLNSELGFLIASNSDGYAQGFNIRKPFQSIWSPWTAGFSVNRLKQEDTLYDAGEEFERYENKGKSLEIFTGRKIRQIDNSVHRLLFGFTDTSSDYLAIEATQNSSIVPDSFNYQYPWIEYQYIHNDFVEGTNIQQINRIEDINLGVAWSLRLGYTEADNFRLNQNVLLESQYLRYFQLDPKQIIKLDLNFSGQLGNGEFENTIFSTQINYHLQNLARGQFYVSYLDARAINPLGNRYLEIGGDTGLRGYPVRFQIGDRLQLITLEQRFYGQKEWFSLFHAGLAVFFDAGHVWGEAPFQQSEPGWHKDIGIGLRLANTRIGSKEGGGHSTIHIDLAAPLDQVDSMEKIDSFQLILTVKQSF